MKAAVVVTLLSIGAASGAVLAILGAVAAIWRLTRPVREFLDDWQGEPARHGYPGRPGVPARLNRIEQRLTQIEHSTRETQ